MVRPINLRITGPDSIQVLTQFCRWETIQLKMTEIRSDGKSDHPHPHLHSPRPRRAEEPMSVSECNLELMGW